MDLSPYVPLPYCSSLCPSLYLLYGPSYAHAQVGGGPTGVELAAELHDLVTEDVSRLMPHLKDDISITM